MTLQERLTTGLAGRYRVERELGRGGMAVVFLGRDLRHERDVAIKVLLPEIGSSLGAERFLREIRIAAALQHPNILPLYDSGEVPAGDPELGRGPPLLYFVMPYVAGESLRERLKREKQLPIEEVVRMARETAEGLTYAHGQGIVHRDVKPENVMLMGGHAMVADFGVARAVTKADTGRLTSTGLVIGTPLYMSPEQATAEAAIDERSDVYALGCLVYEMLAGEPPFTGPTQQAIIARHVQAPVPSLRITRSTIPDQVQRAIEKAMAKVPADRFASAIAFADALEAAFKTPIARRRAVDPWRLTAAAVGGALLLAAAYAGWKRLSPPAPLGAHLVAIAPFEVLDPELGLWREGLMDLLARDLNGAGPLRVVSPSVVLRGWSGRADVASAERLGRRTGASLGVVGTLVPSDSGIVRLGATLVDVEFGRPIEQVEVTGDVARIDRLADSLTVGLLQAISRTRALRGIRFSAMRSRSLSALKAYLRGEQFFRLTAWDSAQASYQRAIELDSTLALAYHRTFLVRFLRGSGTDSLIWAIARRAGELNHGHAARDSLVLTADSLIAAILYGGVASDTVSARLPQRLFSTLDFATRRFPDDAELWYQLGLTRYRIGQVRGVSPEEVLESVSRSISLDSTFAPAYVVAIDMALRLARADEAQRLIATYLALGPTGPEADAARMSAALVAAKGKRSPEVDKLLDTASAEVLWKVQGRFSRWPDSAETTVRMMRALLARGPEAAKVASPDLVRYGLATNLGWRGHLRAAYAELLAVRVPRPLLLAQLAIYGGVSADSAAAVIARVARAARWDPSSTGYLLAWWKEQRDTASLHAAERAAQSAITAASNSSAAALARYVSDASRAYVVLVHGDTSEALRRFQALPDSACATCRFERLTTVQLLVRKGRDADAMAILRRAGLVLGYGSMPADAVLRLELARCSERLGDQATAEREFRLLADLWSDADPTFRQFADEARSFLRARFRG